jgi:uncharacterized protein YfdQ (DUF2303 family)
VDQEAIQELFKQVANTYSPTVHKVERGSVLVTREGFEVHELDDVVEKFAPHPLRTEGTTELHTLDSIIAFANAHKRPGETAAYCSLGTQMGTRLVVVFNDDNPETKQPGWGDHKAFYQFPLSDAWKRWIGVAGRTLSVREFAELLEAGIADVRDPGGLVNDLRLPGVRFAGPSELLKLADGLSVRVEQRVVHYERKENGTSTMTFAEEHKDESGEKLSVPNGFVLGLQIFDGGEPHQVPVRLRYRVKEKQVTWTLAPHDAEGIRRKAIEAAAEQFRTACELPLYFGTPNG